MLCDFPSVVSESSKQAANPLTTNNPFHGEKNEGELYEHTKIDRTDTHLHNDAESAIASVSSSGAERETK